MADDRSDRMPKITPHLLARGVDMCPRRLARELDGVDGDARPFTRWRLRAPFVIAATLASASADADGTTRPPTLGDFPSPPDLEPEEITTWNVAAATYVARFGAVAVSAIDHGCDRPTVSRAFGVRVGGAVDVLVRVVDDGAAHSAPDVELRQLDLWGRRPDADPHRNWEIGLAVLRLSRLLSGQRLRIVHLDLLGGAADVADVDYERDLGSLRDAFAARLDGLRARASSGDAVPGTGCGQCRHVAGCPAHREVA